jgi:hypothetical protein
MHPRLLFLTVLVFASAASAQTPITADSPFQAYYAANPQAGESYINIVNSGANGAPLLGPGFGGPAGNICVNVYSFSPDEQLISCCSCLVTPNALVHLSVNLDLTQKTLTQVIPNSVVVKVLATLTGINGTGTNCNQSAAVVQAATPVRGMLAWGTTLHSAPGTVFATTETPFRPVTLSAAELASIGGRCAFILGNGGGYGICNSCKPGGFGAARQ